MDKKTFFTYTTENGVVYDTRKADGMNVAPMGCWIGDTDDNGEPINESDKEFDEFIDLYVTDDEFYNMTDKELNNAYKGY